MEDLLNVIFNELFNDEFENLWDKQYKNQLLKLNELRANDCNQNAIVSGLLFILQKINDYEKETNKSSDFECRLNAEKHLNEVTKVLLGKLSSVNSIENIFQFIKTVANDTSKWLYFKGTLLHDIIKYMNDKQIIQSFTDVQFKEYIELLTIKLDTSNTDTTYESQTYRLWSSFFGFSIRLVSQKAYLNNISSIRHLYEFAFQNITKDDYCPYCKVCYVITSTRPKDLQSIYMCVLEDKDEHFIEILRLLKVALIDRKDFFQYGTVLSFMQEFDRLINNNKSKGKSFANKYYKKFYETLFELYSQCEVLDILQTINYLYFQTSDVLLMKNKADNEFNAWLITKLDETVVLILKKCELKVIDCNSEEFLKTFAEFCFLLTIYIQQKCENRILQEPILNLIITFLNLYQKTKYIDCVSSLLCKHNFFALKNFQEKLQKIVVLIMKSISYYIDNIENENSDSYQSALQSCCSNLASRLQQCSTSVKSVQMQLFTELVDKPIRNKIESEKYFTTTKPLVELVDFNLYSNKEDDLKLLKDVIESAVDQTDSIQPEYFPFYQPRNLFFLTIYRSLCKIYGTRQDIVRYVEPAILDLLKKIEAIDNYVEVALPDQMNINFYLLLAFSSTVLNHPNTCNLAKIITPTFIKLFESLSSNQTIPTLLSNYLASIKDKFPDVLAENATKLWQLHLDNGNFKEAIETIIPLSHQAFLEQYETEYFEKVCTDETYVIKCKNIVHLIAKQLPRVYLKEDEATGQKYIQKWIEISKPICNSELDTTILEVVAILVEELDDDGDLMVLFMLRHDKFELINTNRQQTPFKSDKQITVNDESTINRLSIMTNIYKMLGCKLKSQENCKILIKELIKMHSLYIGNHKFTYFLNAILNIITNKQVPDLVREDRDFFKNIQTNETDTTIKSLATNICDFINGTSLQALNDKLQQNLNNINELKSTVDSAQTNLSELKTTVTKHEKNVTNFNTFIEDIDKKIVTVDQRLETLNEKTLINLPLWSKNILPLLSKDWILIAKKLNFSQQDINSWLVQPDPFISVLQEWFTINKSSDATIGLIKVLKDINRHDCVKIIEDSINDELSKQNVQNDEQIDIQLENTVPSVFISYDWSMKDKTVLLKEYLEKNGFDCWLDVGQMGGGEAQNKRIDRGIRASKVVLCFISSTFQDNETCVRQVNLAAQLDKPIIPLVVEKDIKWPPPGSLGPLFSECLFIRFYQKPKEVTNDERYWPIDKFEELLMQLRQLVPSKTTILNNPTSNKTNPLVFISYQWGLQKDVTALYAKLCSLGITCWLDIKEMGGGDSLYEKIDSGIRNCYVMISCLTEKYALSANCRKEVSLASSIKKPIIPLLFEPNMKYPPSGSMGFAFAGVNYLDFTAEKDKNFEGKDFEELLILIEPHIPDAEKAAVIDQIRETMTSNNAKSQSGKANNAIQTVYGSRTCIIS